MTNTVFVVGLGPGGPQFLTAQAQSALTQAEVLCGYTVYLDLVRPYFPEKEYYSTGMTQEIDRCRWALEKALAHDFCVISLSDRLTPWAVIERRLAAAAMGDFCVALYNPSSKGRPDYLARAVRILLDHGKPPQTVCGLVRNIGREGQTHRILTLAELETAPVDMFTTVFIGNAATRQLSGKMVTPRGYRA